MLAEPAKLRVAKEAAGWWIACQVGILHLASLRLLFLIVVVAGQTLCTASQPHNDIFDTLTSLPSGSSDQFSFVNIHIRSFTSITVATNLHAP